MDRTMWLSMMGLMSLQSQRLPVLLDRLYELWEKYRGSSSSHATVEVPGYEESSHDSNEIYRSVRTYLSSLVAAANAPTVSIARQKRTTEPVFNLPPNHTVNDEFQGAQMSWEHHVPDEKHETGRESKYILKISHTDRVRVLSSYIDHISQTAENLERRRRERKLFSNGKIGGGGGWRSASFRHPSTFETLALQPSLKEKILLDLDNFKKSRDFYRRTGRAWKRGYLLYGPPGTGKSSLIAAIANHMSYDVYYLELSMVSNNADLSQLLLETKSKSVIVIEDIDCAAADLPARDSCDQSHNEGTARRSSAITLSGLLNFADGLWSSCGEEKIMIFTTNYKDRLDPALLRSGRMDMHICLSYCEFEAFKQLVCNYLEGLQEHLLFPSVEEKMKSGGRLTPADICEILFQHKSDPDSAIKAVVHALEGAVSETVIDSSQG
ncbi:AAA-ATPase At4g30250-like [Cryptomeria japonica]|uniref:AAA-ATPase At4g30250-like n=1 Tax=Cryptomeria japonica TaxID=3369 RepID=UPI0027DA5580|nr:AAA-ATPase At4g30250-like [Cryptomeria japonica]